MSDELYSGILDTEFRGNQYFNVVVVANATIHNFRQYAHIHEYEELIVEQLETGNYAVCAVKRDGIWRNPIPPYQRSDDRYLVEAKHLRISEPRLHSTIKELYRANRFGAVLNAGGHIHVSGEPFIDSILAVIFVNGVFVSLGIGYRAVIAQDITPSSDVGRWTTYEVTVVVP